MIGRGTVWLTPEQRAAGLTIPTTTPEGATMTRKPLIPGHTPGQGFGLTRWLVIGLGALLLWQLTKK
jgi:hypothetical protein